MLLAATFLVDHFKRKNKAVAIWSRFPVGGHIQEPILRSQITTTSFFLRILYAAERSKEKEGELQEGGWNPGLRDLKIPHFKLRLAILHWFRVWAFPGECYFSTILKKNAWLYKRVSGRFSSFALFFSFTPFEKQQPSEEMTSSVFRSISIFPDRFFRVFCAVLLDKGLQFCAVSPDVYITIQTPTIHREDASVLSERGLRSRPKLLFCCYVRSWCTHSSWVQLRCPHLRKDMAGSEKSNWNSWEDEDPLYGEKTEAEYDWSL